MGLEHTLSGHQDQLCRRGQNRCRHEAGYWKYPQVKPETIGLKCDRTEDTGGCFQELIENHIEIWTAGRYPYRRI